MILSKNLWLGKEKNTAQLLPRMAAKHGFIAGPDSSKLLSVQIIAESFSSIGVPVFLADVSGDLSGLCEPGIPVESTIARLQTTGLNNGGSFSFPVEFWDIWGKEGSPLRTTVTDIGPLLLSHMLGLTNAQTGTLYTVFKIADEQGLLLLDLKDLKAMLRYIEQDTDALAVEYELISKRSVRAVQKELAVLEHLEIDSFFGEPALDILDLLRIDQQGQGFINILTAQTLARYPHLYSMIVLWLLAEIYEMLPQAGNDDKPQLIFIFNKADLLFRYATTELLSKIEHILRPLSTKGTGVFFVTSNPLRIPDNILGKLKNKIIHALPVYTTSEQKTARQTAEIFRPNPEIDFINTLPGLQKDEALVSFLDNRGHPSKTKKIQFRPPQSRPGPASEQRKHRIVRESALNRKYTALTDRNSAHERLHNYFKYKNTIQQHKPIDQSEAKHSNKRQQSDTAIDKILKSAATSVGRHLGQTLARGLLETLRKKDN